MNSTHTRTEYVRLYLYLLTDNHHSKSKNQTPVEVYDLVRAVMSAEEITYTKLKIPRCNTNTDLTSSRGTICLDRYGLLQTATLLCQVVCFADR